MFDDATVRAAADVAARLNVELAALLAVAEVESGGKAFARVGGKNEPLIRFEGHYFDRRLSAAEKKKARAEGLSSPKAGAVKNPVKQEDRWKLLNRAILINSNAALESVSWGLGQVMGAHWKTLGYGSVSALVNECRASVAGQIEVMARFIETNSLAGHLRRKDWAKFARAYNGPGYAKNAYDTKMARAYLRWSKAKPAAQPASQPAAPEPIRTDSEQAVEPSITDKITVKVVQKRLLDLGYNVGDADGKIGKLTREGILSFRLDNFLPLVPYIDGKMLSSLDYAKPRELPRNDTSAETVREKVPEVRANWVAKMWGKVLALFGFGTSAAVGALDFVAPARGYIDQVRDLAANVPTWVWFAGIGAIAFALWRVAKKGEDQGVEAFRDGSRR